MRRSSCTPAASSSAMTASERVACLRSPYSHCRPWAQTRLVGLDSCWLWPKRPCWATFHRATSYPPQQPTTYRYSHWVAVRSLRRACVVETACLRQSRSSVLSKITAECLSAGACGTPSCHPYPLLCLWNYLWNRLYRQTICIHCVFKSTLSMGASVSTQPKTDYHGRYIYRKSWKCARILCKIFFTYQDGAYFRSMKWIST